MNQKEKDQVVQRVREMVEAPTCCAEAKAAGQRWLEALGTENEAEETRNLIAELEMDIMSAEGLLAFAQSEAGAKVFGGEKAKEVAAHAKEIIEAGGKYCDCPACSAVAAILEKKDELLLSLR